MFERANRMKIRFAYKGLLTVEDLWDLSVQELDKIFKGLNTKLKTVKEESLLSTRNEEDSILDLQVSIVKYIVGVKLAETAEKESLAEKKAKKEKLRAIIAEKQDNRLLNMSEEDLKKMLEEL